MAKEYFVIQKHCVVVFSSVEVGTRLCFLLKINISYILCGFKKISASADLHSLLIRKCESQPRDVIRPGWGEGGYGQGARK